MNEMPAKSASQIIHERNNPPKEPFVASQYEYTITARYGGSFQPWMRIFEVDGKHYLTTEDGLQEAIKEHNLDLYFVPISGTGLAVIKVKNDK